MMLATTERANNVTHMLPIVGSYPREYYLMFRLLRGVKQLRIHETQFDNPNESHIAIKRTYCPKTCKQFITA